jgi:hypothetical protein
MSPALKASPQLPLVMPVSTVVASAAQTGPNPNGLHRAPAMIGRTVPTAARRTLPIVTLTPNGYPF